MWQIVAGAGAVVVAVLGYLWYRVRSGAVAESQVSVLEARVAADGAQISAAQDAAIAAAASQAKELDDEAKEVLRRADESARRQAALDLLARVRGVD